MKDYHLQTPQKEHFLVNRRTHSIPGHAKKPQKIIRKCLNSAFTLGTEDASKGSTEISSISEVSDENHLNEATEDASLESPKGFFEISSISEVSDEQQLHEATENQAISPSSETVAQSDLTVLSSPISAGEGANLLLNHYPLEEWNNGAKMGTFEAEMVVKHLRQTRIQVLNSNDVDLQSKKLLDALIKAVIEELYGLSGEREWFTETVSRKASIVICGFAMWIFAVVAAFFFSYGVGSSFNGPPLT